MLTDDASDEDYVPTKENLIKAMQWLVQGAAPGDSLLFHFSGHGTTASFVSARDWQLLLTGKHVKILFVVCCLLFVVCCLLLFVVGMTSFAHESRSSAARLRGH